MHHAKCWSCYTPAQRGAIKDSLISGELSEEVKAFLKLIVVFERDKKLMTETEARFV